MSARRDLGYVAESDLDLVLLMDARGRGPMSAYIFERLGIPLPDDLSARRSAHAAGSRGKRTSS